MYYSRGRMFTIILGCIYLSAMTGIYSMAYATILWVNDATGINFSGGGSQANPYKTISFAIGFVSPNDTIMVVDGVYNENISIIGKPDFVMRGESPLNKPQIVGQGPGPTIDIDQGASSSTRAMRLENLVISHAATIEGSGIKIFNSSLTINNCEIINNQNSVEGAGIWISSDAAGINPLIENSIISQNTGGSGAGIYCENTPLELRSNEIYANNAVAQNGGALALINCFGVNIYENQFFANTADSGAAVYIESINGQSGNSFFQDNMVYNNNATSDGGALYLRGSSVVWTFETNSIAENSAGNNGGAAYIENVATVFFKENIIVKNTAGNDGGALSFINIGAAILDSNTLTGNNAFNKGGALSFQNAVQVTLGASFSNNLFHNRDITGLNNITSATSIANLNLNNNYWGASDKLLVGQQLSILNILEPSWVNFNVTPTDVNIKLFAPQQYIWFADGKIEFDLGRLLPVGDSTLVVGTHPDTIFAINGNQSFLPKIYTFDWVNVNMSGSDAKISFYLDESELDALGRPVPQTIQVLEKQDTSWNVAVTDANIDGSTISSALPAFNINMYTIGLDLSSLFFVDPEPNRADVNKNSPFKIIFQREMDETSLVKENIAIVGSFSGNIDFDNLFDNPTNTLYLTPQDELQSGETITLTLTDSIKTKSNVAFQNGFSWRFRTSAFRGSAQFQLAGTVQLRSGINEYLFNDFNADQLLELIELSGSMLTIFSNTDGAYIEENSIDTGVDYSKIKLADLDADGTNDIILFNDTGVFAYSYNQTDGFVPIFSKSYTNNGPLMDVLIADFNNDLVPDIAVLLDLGGFRQIDCYYGGNAANYDFASLTSVTLTEFADMFSSTDWNGDGLFDMIASNGLNIARVFNQRNSFTSFFNTLPEITSQTIVTTANVWEDDLFRNADEIIIAGTGGGLNLLKLFNIDIDGVLVETFRRPFTDAIESVFAADLNSDGYNDLVIGHSNNDITLLLSNNGILETQLILSSPVKPSHILSIDYDADGDMDLLVYEHDDSTASTSWAILENESRAPRSWWVDNGAVNGDGSFLNPFAFINEAIEKSFAGDSVFINPGIFMENLNIDHDLYLSSVDSLPVLLKFDQQDLFSTAVLNISGTQLFEAHNLTFDEGVLQAGTQAIIADNNDSLVFKNILIRQFGIAAEFNNSKGELNTIFVEDNDKGLQFNGSDMTLFFVNAERNNEFGLAADNSVLSIFNSEIRENGSNASVNSSGINIKNGSDLTLYEVSISENGNANILVDNSTVSMQFGFVDAAFSAGFTTDGNGIFAQNNAILFLENSVVVDNHKTGIALDNSQATILNSIIANNDSIFQENGGGLFAKNGSTVDLRNTILIGNNTPVSSENSVVSINYNDFFGNNSAVSGASLGIGNISENPLMVFMYNPLNANVDPLGVDVDGFHDLKLAAGSGLIDKGDPEVTNGDTQSRSDIGLFGNLALPEALSSIPEATVTVQDSSVTLSWQQTLIEEQGLFKGTLIFRDSFDNFQPDTSNILSFVQAGITEFQDSDLSFGNEFYYRLAFVDSSGGSNAYSPVIQGRIDFMEFRLSVSSLSVQVGQGDTLIRPVVVTNTGTIPVTVAIEGTLPDWLQVLSKQNLLRPNESKVFLVRFSGENLQKDSLYTAKLELVAQEDSSVRSTLDVQMLVSYRDLKAPLTLLFRLYPDTVRQANLSFSFSANDTIFSTIGTPLDLMRYIYRFVKTDDLLPLIIDADTTSKQRLDFYQKDLKNGTYFFEVAALDTSGNGALGENSVSVTVNIKSGELDIIDGLWQMVSLPRQFLGTAVDINADDLSALRRWQDGSYQHVSLDSIKPGEGYWVFSTSKIKVDLQKYPVIESDNDFRVDLQEGWNMIGNPWSWNIGFDEITFTSNTGTTYNFDAAISEGVVNSGIYYWQASKLPHQYINEVSGKMKINTGYWLLASQPLSIQYNPHPFALFDGSLQKTNAPANSSDQDAIVRLKVKHKDSEDNNNYFGLCFNKSDYPYFYQNALEPPAIGENIRLYSKIDNRQLTTNLVLFSAVDSSHTWNLVIEGSAGEDEIVLSWENVNNSAQIYFYLYHLESGEWFNIDDRDFFKIKNRKSINHFKLIATEDENFKPEILPIKFALSQNYPNPFNPATTIRLSVPFFADGKRIRLDIFDVLGRKVKNLLDQNVKSGEFEVTWQGKNNLGKQVASGIYFYRIVAGDFTASRKMILLR